MKRTVSILTGFIFLTILGGFNPSGTSQLSNIEANTVDRAPVLVNHVRLSRDLVRRIQKNIYLTGLHTVMLNEDSANHQSTASLGIINSRYRAALLMASVEMMEK